MISIKYNPDMEFEIKGENGKINRIKIPPSVVEDMLQKWGNEFFRNAINSYMKSAEPPTAKSKTKGKK